MEPIQCTAGAVPILNEKGEVSMQKVKVHRYVSGKRPEYAPHSSSSEVSEDEDFVPKQRIRQQSPEPIVPTALIADDPRLRRLITRHSDQQEEGGVRRRRPVHEPEILEESESSADEQTHMVASGDEDEEEELSDEEIERRRQLLRQRVLSLKNAQKEEVLEREEERAHSAEGSDGGSSGYEEYSDSDEDTGPRLKPVFVRKKDRVTIIEKEKEAAKKRAAEAEAKKRAEERRRQTVKMVEDEIRKEQMASKKTDETNLNDVNTDDEDEELEYEAWKLREMKRIKRDREEKEQREREQLEIERLRNMTEEDRRQEFRLNPKTVTNKSVKGKYKFMQKYYHRGAFYLDTEDQIFKRNFATATLDDHFDKTVLPKVMQVKNFGRSGRTKYTHLVDQDTTQYDSPWVSETTQNLKFQNNQAAGVKQVFSRPSLRKHKSK